MAGKDVATIPAPSSAMEEFMKEFGNGAPAGLEDVGADDVALAMIKIDHTKAVFVDSLTGESYEEIDGVMLGLIKQRVMWDPDPDAKSGPLCKSHDSLTGHPRDAFPWESFKAHEPIGSHDVACGTCTFAQWGSHPKNDTPWCSAMYTFPVVIGESPNVSGLLSFQRSGLAACKAYMSGFVRDRKPLFSHRTKISLEQSRKGTVYFCTPKFERGPLIEDITLWRAWQEAYNGIKALTGYRDLGDQDALVTPAIAPASAVPF